MIRLTCVLAALALAAMPAMAEENEDIGGTLNPLDSGIPFVMKSIEEGKTDMMTCAMGYYITKSGRHEMARKVFESCAKAGYTGAMTWMSQMENNGLGGPENPEAAADWDRKAAEAGDPVGKFNYGLDLMRGHGVAQDDAQGRRMVDAAAAEGLDIARRLQGADYNLDEVTPDADEWKYKPMF